MEDTTVSFIHPPLSVTATTLVVDNSDLLFATLTLMLHIV